MGVIETKGEKSMDVLDAELAALKKRIAAARAPKDANAGTAAYSLGSLVENWSRSLARSKK